jgi:hypothetical protein
MSGTPWSPLFGTAKKVFLARIDITSEEHR